MTGAKIHLASPIGAKIPDGIRAEAPGRRCGGHGRSSVRSRPRASGAHLWATFNSGASAGLSDDVTDFNVGDVFDAAQPAA